MSQLAQHIFLGQFFQAGSLVTAPKLYHYEAGTANDKNIYQDRTKNIILPQPYIGDANGVLSFFASGLYKFVVKNSDNSATLWVADSIQCGETPPFFEGSVVHDPGSLSDGAGETFTCTVAGATIPSYVAVAAPYDLQGMTCTAYVHVTDGVTIRLQNESGGAINLASGTWYARVYPAA